MRSSPLFFSGRHAVTGPKSHGTEPVALHYGMWSARGKQLRGSGNVLVRHQAAHAPCPSRSPDDHDVVSLTEPHRPYRHPVRVRTLPVACCVVIVGLAN
jgi:hypothetical protein